MADDEKNFGDVEEFGGESFGDASDQASEISIELNPIQVVHDEAVDNYKAARLLDDEIGMVRYSKIVETCLQQLAQPTVAEEPITDPIANEDWNWLLAETVKIYGVERGTTWLNKCQADGHKFKAIYDLLAETWKLKPEETKKTKTRKPKEEKAPKAAEPVAVPIQEDAASYEVVDDPKAIFDSIVKQGADAGLLDPHLVWDEIELTDLSIANLTAFFDEMQKRIKSINEGFGFEEPAQVGSGVEATQTAPPVEDWLEAKINKETGEVELPALLRALGWLEVPQELSLKQAEQIIDIIVTRRAKAERHENQIKKIIKPLQDSADRYEQQFGQLLDKYFEKHQPKTEKGEYKGKTMELRTGTLSYRGSSGGYDINAEGTFHEWLRGADAETRNKYNIQLEYTLTASELDALGITAKITEMGKKADYQYDRKTLLAKVNKNELPAVPGMIKTVAQPLLKRTIE